jgi:hypothetical protein
LHSSSFRYGALLLSVSVLAQAPNPDHSAFFEKSVRPLLASHCYGCHSSKLSQPMSGLKLDTRAGVLRGGASGAPAIVPGKPDESLLIMAVRRTHPTLKMPPDQPLEPGEIDTLVEWVKMGAPDPRAEANPAVSEYGNYDWNKLREHWSFRPVQDPRPPQLASAASAEWNHSAIDKFVKAKLDEKGLKPLSRAAKLVLIRRATYDLTGLPPTPRATGTG